MAEVTDALLAAEEILETLYLRGTRGLEQESSAGRIADALWKVRAAKRCSGAVGVAPEQEGK